MNELESSSSVVRVSLVDEQPPDYGAPGCRLVLGDRDAVLPVPARRVRQHVDVAGLELDREWVRIAVAWQHEQGARAAEAECGERVARAI
eukprot:1481965-Prymnesium_polylepis.1